MKLPNIVNIAGVPYTITYCESASEVDIFKRESLWGQVDPWTKTIRVYKNNNPLASVFKILFHEIFHAYGVELNMPAFISNNGDPGEVEEAENNCNEMANVLFDLIDRNEWIVEVRDVLQIKQDSYNISE